MSLKIEDISLLQKLISEYSIINIKKEQTTKKLNIDTAILSHERIEDTLKPLESMEPFGNSNEEPVFILHDTIIKSVEKVGSKGK